MSDGIALMVARSRPGLPLRLRGRVALTFMAITVAACLGAAALLLSGAADEQHAIENRGRA